MVEESAEPSSRVDREWSSFVPQSHTGMRKVKIMQITCKKGEEIGAREDFLFFLHSGSALIPHGFSAHSSQVIAFYRDAKEK